MMKFKFPDSMRLVFNKEDYQPNSESPSNRRQRRSSTGKNKVGYDNPKSAKEWIALMKQIQDEDGLKAFQQIVNRQHPRNIPVNQLRALGFNIKTK